MTTLLRYLEDRFVLPGQNIDETRKRTFMSLGIITITPFIVFFALDDIIYRRLFEGIIVFVAIAVFLLNLLALKHMKNMLIVYRLDTILILALLSYGLAIGAGNEHSFLWYYFFPLAAFYLFELKEGLMWVSVSLLLASFFFLTPAFHDYSLGVSLRFLITYNIVLILSFGLESARDKYYRELILEKKISAEALNEVKILRGLLPICSYCKRIRDDLGQWSQVEDYIHAHSEADFTHGICPDCTQKFHPKQGSH